MKKSKLLKNNSVKTLKLPLIPPSYFFYTFVICLILLVMVHFGLPIIASYDSVHYHLLQNVLEKKLPWSHWDPLRVVGFPLLLMIESKLFASQPFGFLIGSFLRYLLIMGIAAYFIHHILRSSFYKYVCGLFVFVFVFLDPVILGYYHALLTESIASTLMILSVFCIMQLINTNQPPLKKRTFFTKNTLFFFLISVLIVCSYEFKQTFISVTLFPLVGGVVLSYFLRQGLQKWMTLLGLCLFSITLVLITHQAWNKFLQTKSLKEDYYRTTTGFFAKFLISGLYYSNTSEEWGNRYYPMQKLSDLSIQNIQTDPLIKPLEKEEIVHEMLSSNREKNQCSSIVKLYDLNLNPIGKILLLCSSEVLSVRDSAKFLLRVLVEHPSLFFLSYIKAFSVMIGVTENKFGFYENEVIARKAFRIRDGESNVFYVPPGILEESAKDLQQNIVSGKISRSPIRYLNSISQFLFSFVFVLAVIGLAAQLLFLIAFRFSVLSYFKRKKFSFLSKVENFIKNYSFSAEDKLLFIVNFAAFTHVLADSIILVPCDRYAFPVYPALLLIHIIFIFRKIELKIL